MKTLYTIFTFLSFITLCHQSAEAQCSGKVDIGPAYVHIDLLESGHTVKRLDMAAVKADATIVPLKNYFPGLCLKPTILYGSGHGDLFTTGIGIGHFIPVNDKLCLTPSIGYTYTDLRARINLRNFGLLNLKEKFRSNGIYLCLEANYKFWECWRISGQIQYVWSHTHTTISQLPGKQRSNAKGFNYAALLERDLNQCWSVNLGFAYNESLTHERHGLRGYGTKVGIAYWF